MTKEEMRERIKKEMELLDLSYCQKSGKRIQEHLFSLPQYQKAQTLFVYVSVGKEPDTREIIEDLWKKGKRVCVPCVLGKGIMEARILNNWEELSPVGYGLQEPPRTNALVLPTEIDFLVVPCVTCDEEGWRLGHGAGYYDRYLVSLKAETVCLCYQKILQKQVPREYFDVQMNKVLTEDNLYRSTKNKQ